VAVRPGGVPLPGRPRLFAPVAVIFLLLLIGAGVFVSQYTDYLWFSEANHSNVFTTVLKTKLLLFVGGALIMGSVIGANIAVAYRNRPPFRPVSLEQQNLERYRLAIEPYLVPVLLIISTFFGIFAGLSTASRWRTWLLWQNGTSFGVKDPQFHKDISYFTFTYPFQRFLLGFVFVVLVLALIASAVTHYLFGGVRLQTSGEKISVAARVHLSVLIGVIVLLKALAYWLDRYGLAFSGRGVVQGASYTDVNAVLPAKTMLTFVAIICALLFFANIVVRNVVLPAGALALLVVSAIAVGGVYPLIVQTYQVKPNEITKESKYIQRNIDATRTAYQIADAKVSEYEGVSTASKTAVRDDKGTIPNIRLLDPNILGPTFRQRQAIRTNYFSFNTSLDIDRYTVNDKTQDYVVAARELDQSRLNSDKRNWINLHLAYTHGNGFVAAPASTVTGAGEPAFTVKDLPVKGDVGALAIDEPRIYYGEASPNYSIVDTKQGEIDGPGETGRTDDETTTHYTGDGGVKLNSGFRKLLYALKFRDKNILLSGSLTKDSKLQYIRQPAERVKKVAPFLQVDSDPYPVVVEGRILWVVDGYTTSSGYPYSQRTTLGEATSDSQTRNSSDNTVNYIRNSVKATVDAFSGEVKLYTWDEKDPVLKTWGKAFKGLLLPKSAIGTELAKHFRYPEDYFKVQRELLTKYHVTNATVFYQGEDFWQIPGDPTQDAAAILNAGTSPSPNRNSSSSGPAQPPYYSLLQMPDQTAPTFSLTSTFVSRNGTNLTAFAAVSSDPGDYGTIRVLDLPKDTQVDGPGQVANTFEGDPNISRELTLLRGGSSEVVLGNLLTLPVAKGLLYVEPVYTQSRQNPKFPILRRVIVGFGSQVVFQPTLAQALDQLFGTGSGSGVPTQSPSPGQTPTPGTSNQTVTQLIAAAQRYYDDGQTALKNGDFAAYGTAQQRLKTTLDELAAASGSTGTPSSTPTPSPSLSKAP
jgi:uncharacterized membrane protein (UPF0182 family)